MQQGEQHSQQVVNQGADISMAQCQSMCSAALAAEACKLLPPDAQASPVFVQASGTPGFYIGAYCIGNHILVTEEAMSERMALVRQKAVGDPTYLTVDQNKLLDISNSVKDLPLPELMSKLAQSKISTWALYAEMGAGKQQVAADGGRKV